MNAISENPFRVLGLFANCSEREIQKQVAALSAYARVGKAKGVDFDLAFLGEVSRKEETIRKAANRIEQAANKVDHALFWFVKTNHIDEAALNHLRAGDIYKAAEIWELPIKDKPIGKRNVAAALNLSTLQLAASFQNGKFDAILFEKGIRQKGRVLSSDSFESFVKTIAGDNVKIDKDRTAKEFAEEILKFSDQYSTRIGESGLANFVEAFSSFPEKSRRHLQERVREAIAQFREQVPQIIKEKNVKLAKELVEDMGSLHFTLSDAAMGVRLYIQWMKEWDEEFELHKWSDPNKARILINQGLSMAANNPTKESMRALNREIANLQPGRHGPKSQDDGRLLTDQ